MNDAAPDITTDGTPTPVEEPTAEELCALDQALSQLALAFATASPSRIEPLALEWLERLTRLLAVDRVTLYEYSEADAGLHAVLHFRNAGIDPPPSALNVGEVPAVVAALKRGEVLRYERLRDVPVIDRVGIAPFRFPSVLGAPFAVEGAIGYLILSTLRAERRFHDAVVQRLRTIAEVLAHGIARLRREQRLGAREPERNRPEFAELLLAIVGHDLRNPLSAVSGLAQLLRAKEGLPPEMVRRIAAIDQAAKRMNDMIATLLDFGESQLTGSLALARTPTDLQVVCAQAIALHTAVRPATAIVFDDAGPVRGVWDPARLQQLVGELLSNALTRAESNSIFLSLSLEGETAVLCVRDRGAPIAELVLRQIFEPLAPIPSGQSPWAQGVALRLHIAQQIAHSHGGALSVESSRDGGTQVTVRLPVVNVA